MGIGLFALKTIAVAVFALLPLTALHSEGTPTSVTDLQPMDCVLTPEFLDGTLSVVPCTAQHTAEVFAIESISRPVSSQDALKRCKKVWRDTYDVGSNIVWIRGSRFNASKVIVCQVYTAETQNGERWVYTQSYLSGLERVKHRNFFVQFAYNIGVFIVICLVIGAILLFFWLGR